MPCEFHLKASCARASSTGTGRHWRHRWPISPFKCAVTTPQSFSINIICYAQRVLMSAAISGRNRVSYTRERNMRLSNRLTDWLSEWLGHGCKNDNFRTGRGSFLLSGSSNLFSPCYWPICSRARYFLVRLTLHRLRILRIIWLTRLLTDKSPLHKLTWNKKIKQINKRQAGV